MENSPYKQDNFLQQSLWQRVSSRHNLSAIFLLLVLIGCIFSAQLLVWARSGSLISEQNGHKIIKEISRRGINYYLGDKAVTNYYTLKQKGVFAGYAAWHIKPIRLSDGSLVFKINEIQVDIAAQNDFTYNFIVANDISWFKYSEPTLDAQSNITTINRIWYKNGKLILPDIAGPQKEISPSQIGLTNMVPLPLIDLVSSVTADLAKSDGATFMAISSPQRMGTRMIIHPQKFIVQPVASLSAAEKKRFGSKARAVLVTWPGEITRATEQILKQKIIYDNHHQLLWQKDIPLHLERLKVSRTQLLQVFPQAGPELYKWLLSINN